MRKNRKQYYFIEARFVLIIEYEKTTDCINKILPKIFISDEKSEVSLLSMLFAIWIGGYTKIWCRKRDHFSFLENSKM